MKLTKAQADYIEFAKTQYGNESIVVMHAGETDIEGMSLDTLIRALYIGYDIELTPEEKILSNWEQRKDEGYAGYKRGVLDTLNALNITIKGIND